MPTLTLPKAGGGFVTHSIPDVAQDVMVLVSATQILTNKTINSLLGAAPVFTTSLTLTGRFIASAGALVFQEATTISTTTGNLIFSASSLNVFTSGVKFNSNVRVQMGTNGEVALTLRSASLGADEELSNHIEGTSNHQGYAANTLLLSNISDNGDMIFLVSDGGDSIEMIKMTAATAELSLGWGALKIGLGKDLAAITRPASVTADASSIITALINLGLFTS